MAKDFLEGKYRGKILEWGLSESSKGSLRWESSIQIESREDEEGEWQDVEVPEPVTVYAYLTPGAIAMTLNKLRSLGYADTSINRLSPAAEDYHDFAGSEVTLNAKVEQFQGRDIQKFDLGWAVGSARKIDPKRLSGIDVVNAVFAAEAAKLAASNKGEKEAEEKPKAGRKRKA